MTVAVATPPPEPNSLPPEHTEVPNLTEIAAKQLDEPTPDSGAAQASTTPLAAPQNKARKFQQYDDVYVTRVGHEVTFVHVINNKQIGCTQGVYHTVTLGDLGGWIPEVLAEAARISRKRSTVRLHTMDSDLSTSLRDWRTKPELRAKFADIHQKLRKDGQDIILARAAREHPVWRTVMKLFNSGQMVLPNPLVTYSVYTAAITDFDKVYSGVVTVGMGSITVYAEANVGDDLVEAEMRMVRWVIDSVGGGGRIDLNHATDGARRIWEQIGYLATVEGADPLGTSGEGVRAILRSAVQNNLSLTLAKKSQPELCQLAKAAACSQFIGMEAI